MFSRILVPLDGSKLAERVLPHASEFAHTFGACVVLLQVLDPSTLGEGQQTLEPFTWQIRKAEADIYLKTTAARLKEQEDLAVETVLLEGKTAETIIDYTQNQDIDLLVISTHGASGLSRWNTSSVFQKVINKVYQDILIVRAYQGVDPETLDPYQVIEGRPEDLDLAQGISKVAFAQVEPVMSHHRPAILPTGGSKQEQETPETQPAAPEKKSIYQRILLPFDTSRRAECPFPTASTLAEHCGGTLVLAGVIQRPKLPFPVEHTEEATRLAKKLVEISRETTAAYLNELSGRLNVQVDVRIIESDSVHSSIYELAEEENADLVIFCAHGASGQLIWPYGSVVQSYIDHGTRPVLVVQDMPRSQVRPTAAEIAADKYGRR